MAAELHFLIPMQLRRYNKSVSILVILLAFFIQNPLFAETATPPKTQTPPQTEQESDRSKSAGAAQAAAMAGAAVAGLSCVMLMKQAQEAEEPEKSMLMMQAMQQCSQAAQSAQNAGQNKNAKDAVKLPETPATPDFTNKALANQQDSSNSNTPLPSQNTSTTTKPFTLSDDLDSLLNRNLDPKADSHDLDGFKNAKGPTTEATGNGFTTLSPIDPKKVEMDENKNPTPADSSNINRGIASFTPVSQSLGVREEGKKDTLREEAKDGRKNRDASIAEANGGDTVSATSSKEEAPANNFDQMLSQLMGGGQGGEDPNVFLGSGGLDIVPFRADPTTGQKPNIFEFASYQYRSLSYEQGRIKSNSKIIPSDSKALETDPIAALSRP